MIAEQAAADATELVLVRLRIDASDDDRARIARTLATWGARIHIAATWGWIVEIGQSRKTRLANDRSVAVAGGVQLSGRRIPRIRITTSDIDTPDNMTTSNKEA